MAISIDEERPDSHDVDHLNYLPESRHIFGAERLIREGFIFLVVTDSNVKESLFRRNHSTTLLFDRGRGLLVHHAIKNSAVVNGISVPGKINTRQFTNAQAAIASSERIAPANS